MKKTYIMKTVCAVGLTAACAWGLAACSSGTSSGTGGVAGTVNGVDIPEDTITNYIQGVRDQLGAGDEESWGTWLAQNNYTPASVRDEVVNSFAQRELVKKAIEEKGITVESSEIDQAIQSVKQNFDTDEKWQSALDQAGMTEESYRAEIEQKLKENKLYASFAPEEDPSESDMLQYAQMYASTYDGAKRSSHILFDASDEAKAQEVLDKINSGELDFVDAVKEYSTDSVSAAQDGDVGWDNPSKLASDYKAGVAPLEKGQVSGLVTTQFGIHIIKCTDVYEAPKTTADDGTEKVEITSLDQIPPEWVDEIKTKLQMQKQQDSYNQWLKGITEAADIKVNDMPQGLPYDLDMSKYEAAATDQGATDGSADGATDGGDTADGTTNGSADNTDNADAAGGAADTGTAADSGAGTSDQPAEAS